MICIFKVIHYCYLMYLSTPEICDLIYTKMILQFLSTPGLASQAALKRTKLILELNKVLTDIGLLLMVEKDVQGRICHSICRYKKCNNKYMRDYDKK